MEDFERIRTLIIRPFKENRQKSGQNKLLSRIAIRKRPHILAHLHVKMKCQLI